MERVSGNTKWKVISGYIILFLLSLLFAILIYKQITKLITNEGTANNFNQKLFLVGNITTGLYEAEALSNAFIQTGSPSYFEKYTSIIEQTGINIDSLEKQTLIPEQQIRIDSVNILLEEKVRNLQELAWIKRKFTPEDFYDKAMNSIESGRRGPDKPNMRKRLVTQLDTSYVRIENKKRRWIFFKARPDSIAHITSSLRTVIDTMSGQTMTQTSDSVINILKSTWEDIQKQTRNFNRQVNQREYALIVQSTNITKQLKRILNDYEKEELHHALSKQQNREQAVNSMLRIFAWVAIAALLLVILFIFFILRDLSRSQRYRRELEDANNYAGQLLKSREKIILTITHDIKSPLSSIIGYIELLDNISTTDRQRYFLKNMKGSSEHILKLITNLLDLSRLENNKLIIEKVTFNPAHLFNEIKETFIPLALEKQLKLEGEFSEELNNSYRGDALRIRQIITNILSNAIKYTHSGCVFITATSSADNQQLIIKIQDTGSGMTPEEQKMIFEEFTRLSSHSAIEGTGLGLTITLKLIHLLNGEILLESEPGKGSCFTITLPLEKATNSDATAATRAVKTPVSLNANSGGLKILLVDDDPLQLEMTMNLLLSKGLQAEMTTLPQEVIDKLTAGDYDLVFSDIQMPEMDGFELIRHIRNLPGTTAEIPVIALSADSGKQEKDYLESGFTAYLPKPFNSDQLIGLINQVMNMHLKKNISAESSEKTVVTNGYTLDHILKFTDNDPESLDKIIASFIVSTHNHLDLLRQFIAEKQTDSITHLAHKMLPMFKQLETREIVVILEKLEHSAKIGLSEKEITALTREVIAKIEILLHSME